MSETRQSRPEGEPPQKLAAAVAAKIGQEIARRGWPIGERLGSEPDLMKRYKVSRAVLREAVRILEREDVAATRRGPNGGLFVKAPSENTAVKSMSHYLDFAGVGPFDLYEARWALELHCVELAATRIDEVGVKRLRDHLAREAESVRGDIVDPAHEFHRLLAELTGNNALLLFVQCATELASNFSRRDPRSVQEPRLTEQIHAAHRRIAAAVIDRDAALARRHMTRHLEAIMWSVQPAWKTSGVLNPGPSAVDGLC